MKASAISTAQNFCMYFCACVYKHTNMPVLPLNVNACKYLKGGNFLCRILMEILQSKCTNTIHTRTCMFVVCIFVFILFFRLLVQLMAAAFLLWPNTVRRNAISSTTVTPAFLLCKWPLLARRRQWPLPRAHSWSVSV